MNYGRHTNFHQMCLVCVFVFQIVHRYDIILIQEVRDSDLSATKRLMEHVNKLDAPTRLTQSTHSIITQNIVNKTWC